MEKVIAFIPAIIDLSEDPDDLTQLFCGRPLIHWTVEALQQCSVIKQIVIATNNGRKVTELSTLALPKVQLYSTAHEDASVYEKTEIVLSEYLRKSNLAHQDIFILVDYHFPLIRTEHYLGAIDLIRSQSNHSVFSAVRNRYFYWTQDGISINYNYHKRPLKKELRKELLETGAFYATKVGSFIANINRLSGRIAPYELPAYTIHQLSAPTDWLVGEVLMHQYRIDHQKKTGFGRVRLVISDVDGVLTDGSMYYTENGDEIKRFHTYDGMAFGLLRDHGIKTALITSEDTQMVANRAKKLKIDHLYQGRRHGGKLAAIQEICAKEEISLEEVLYIGDDINCREALQAVGFAFCPANALPDIRMLPNVIQLETKGGSGAVREVYEKYLRPSLVP